MTPLTERIGPKGSPRRTAALMWVCLILMSAGFAWLAGSQAASDARAVARDAAQDKVIQQQVTDADAYRRALASKGVNPNSVAPPPQVRTAPLASLPAAAPGLNGTNGRDGKDGINGINGKDGKDGAAGPAPSCLAEPTQCRGADGLNGTNGQDGKDGKDGTNGLNGVDGRSVATLMLRESSPGRCELTGTFSDGTTWTAAGATIPCVATGNPAPPSSPAAQGVRRAPAAAGKQASPRPSAAPTAPARATPSGARRVVPGLPLDWAMLALVLPFGVHRLGERKP